MALSGTVIDRIYCPAHSLRARRMRTHAYRCSIVPSPTRWQGSNHINSGVEMNRDVQLGQDGAGVMSFYVGNSRRSTGTVNHCIRSGPSAQQWYNCVEHASASRRMDVGSRSKPAGYGGSSLKCSYACQLCSFRGQQPRRKKANARHQTGPVVVHSHQAPPPRLMNSMNADDTAQPAGAVPGAPSNGRVRARNATSAAC